MVIIVANEQDISTYKVVDWLHQQNEKVEIFHQNKKLFIENITLSNTSPLFKRFSEVTSFWYRNGNFIIDTNKVKVPSILNSRQKLISQIEGEINTIVEYIHEYLSHISKKVIGKYKLASTINKIDVLRKAVDCGLNTPDTIITSKKEELICFKSKYKSIISKPLSESIILNEKDSYVFTYTAPIINLETIPDIFFPSLFQEEIPKKYEVRAFYLKENIYSCAIFSQKDNSTKNDFRNYNLHKPNRYIPYQLPKRIELKLINLMKKLNFDTGSIDLLVDNNNKFYFLEVNPAGQFGMISNPCNYNLYKIISEYLI